jgi:hypothetical protein
MLLWGSLLALGIPPGQALAIRCEVLIFALLLQTQPQVIHPARVSAYLLPIL